MPDSSSSGPDASALDAFKVFELVNCNADPERITCVYEWDDQEGRPVRCDKDIDEDRQIKAWKQLLVLPWGSEDPYEWRSALGGAVRLLSCGKHSQPMDLESVTMGWASQARLHTFKQKGDCRLLGSGGHAPTDVVEGIRAPKPRRATTAQDPRVLVGTAGESSHEPCVSHGSPAAECAKREEQALRKDSALGSSTSRDEWMQKHSQPRLGPKNGDSTIFQLDEEARAIHAALRTNSLGAASLPVIAAAKRLRSRSDPEVHLNSPPSDEAADGRPNWTSILFRTDTFKRVPSEACPASQSGHKAPHEEILDAKRTEVEGPELETIIRREHELGCKPQLEKNARLPRWDLEMRLRQRTYAAGPPSAPTPEQTHRQNQRDHERLEEEIRAHLDAEAQARATNLFHHGTPAASFHTIQTSWSTYMNQWISLLTLSSKCTAADLFPALPRPVLGPALAAKYASSTSPSTPLPASFERDVGDFYKNMPGVTAMSRGEVRKKLKMEVARFHPDKIRQRFPVAGGDMRVVEFVTRVTQVVTVLIARA